MQHIIYESHAVTARKLKSIESYAEFIKAELETKLGLKLIGFLKDRQGVDVKLQYSEGSRKEKQVTTYFKRVTVEIIK